MLRTTVLMTTLSFAAIPGLAQTQDPTRHLRANLTSIDADGDGVISRAELRTAKAARWQQIDRNGDGYLGEDDFPPGAAQRARTQLAEIAHLDRNGDGKISRDEFLDGPASAFMQADTNSDGILTRSEVDVPPP